VSTSPELTPDQRLLMYYQAALGDLEPAKLPPVPAMSRDRLAWRAREHHEQWLAMHATDATTFERLSATSATVRGDVVELRCAGGVVRYRWSWRLARPGSSEWVLRFEAVP